MIDFMVISTRSTKRGVIEIYPKFIIKKSTDLMIRGGDFYAIWIEERGLWSTDEQDALQLIDRELDRYAEENRQRFNSDIKVLHMAALEEMKRKGYIRYVGVSNFTAEQIKEAEQYIQIDVQQPLYSMVDRGFEDLMSWGYDRGIDSMTYGSMGAGILSGKIRSVPSFEKNDLRLNFYDVYKEPKFSKIMELLKVMDSIADGHNVPVGQVALNWSTQKEYVGTALVGVRSIEHADENCKTFDWKLTEEEMKILDSKIEECAL